MSGRVNYMVLAPDNRAASIRLLNAIVEAQADMLGLYRSGKTLVSIVRMRPEREAKFRETAKLQSLDVLYSSPTYFDNGTLRSIYGSPEDEVIDRKTQHYIDYCSRKEGQ